MISHPFIRCICFSSLVSGLHADILPGAWDSFTNEEPAKEGAAWDSNTNEFWLPVWSGPVIYGTAEHRYSIAWSCS
jgi:hypothetical protein